MKRFSLAMIFIFLSQQNYADSSACIEKNNFCPLSALRTDPVLLKQFRFSDDPAGLDAQALGSVHEAEQALQTYVNTHNCELYSLSFLTLIQGLMKGSLTDLDKDNGHTAIQDNEKKFFIIEGDKGVCIKKLGMKLPIKHIIPIKK